MKRDRQHASRSRTQSAEGVTTLFFCGDVFEVTLLLFDAHVAESHRAFELRSDALAKVGERECFDVEGVGARELRFGVLVLAILFDRDREIFGDDELRTIL